jgi:cellulose synthase operon protein C
VVRLPGPQKKKQVLPPSRPPRDGGEVALRLAIGKDGLGIELARPATIGPLVATELTVRLPHVRFPFDVSGGVAKFRHKRGELERLAVELDERRAARWAEPKLRGLVAEGPCEVTIVARAFGATITVRSGTTALAFEVAVVPTRDEIVVVAHRARGAHLREPATALAVRALAALLGDDAKREGAKLVVARPAEKLARALLPEAGARAPDGGDVRLAGCGESDGVVFAMFTRGGTIATVPNEVTLASEAAGIARGADDARFARDYEKARALDLAAYERAPRHPEIARRIAELDAHAGGRAEAALATLRESSADRLGLLAARLMIDAGDSAGALATLLREGEHEPANVIAALAFDEASLLTKDPDEILRALDRAVARAPRIAELRWKRAHRRLLSGRLADARADFQELEALAQGARDRHAVLRRTGDVYRDAGLGAEAALSYERALLYRPDDAEAIAGLGIAIAAEGRAARGAALLQHAIELATRKEETERLPWMHLELARVLGDRLDDKPDAVARLRSIPDEAREAIDARGLEGRYRAAIGDLPGAALAYARLRERAGRERAAIPWLLEAARFEEERNDLAAAQRHLATATSVAPDDVMIAERLRSLSERIAREAGVRVPEAIVEAPPEQPAPEAFDESDAEQRVETLTRALQADPNNDAVIDELVGLLSRLGRSMDLLALLSARLEDAPPDRRDQLLPKHREVLLLLEEEARADGREAEADLFKMARESSV